MLLILYILGGILLLLLLFVVYVIIVSRIPPPRIKDTAPLKWQREQKGTDCYTIGKNWFRKNNAGLYELSVTGTPFERGVAYGKLTTEQVIKQEDAFTEQIQKLVPSTIYQHFLKYFIGFFNRNLPKYIRQEYKEEIYGISHAASKDYGYIGTPYERLLNYHAAHDIGHALQSMALVGCTSFATWGERSENGELIIGRNFDFYAGDKFAEDKIAAFYRPDEGHKFMIVTWAGFVGAVSGMNEHGLTVTINAAKSSIPTGAATPVSLVAREILQYAKNIDEAWAIAKKRKMFVSESFLIGSAADKCAVIIEKTPHKIDMYDPNGEYITCANHFQGPQLINTSSNQKQLHDSASSYRYQRLEELLQQNGKNTISKTADILRNYLGLQGRNIGMGNEKAINQFIAHHSVIFAPERRLVWVSTAPWQLGQYVCYDLNKVFNMDTINCDNEISEQELNIPADSLLDTEAFKDFTAYQTIRHQITEGEAIDIDSLLASNPEYFHTYELAGNYLFTKGNLSSAAKYYKIALTKEISTQQERDRIQKQLEKCQK